MSTAWKGSVVLLEEPAGAFWGRLGYRVLMAVLLTFLASYISIAWLAAPVWLFAGVAVIFVAFSVINRIKNKGAILVHTGAGSIEWPRSIQEVLLRRPVEFVAAREIEVTYPPVAAMPGRADPRVILSDGERQIPRVPLHGVDPKDFVAHANERLKGRGTVLRYVEREESGAESEASDDREIESP